MRSNHAAPPAAWPDSSAPASPPFLITQRKEREIHKKHQLQRYIMFILTVLLHYRVNKIGQVNIHYIAKSIGSPPSNEQV